VIRHVSSRWKVLGLVWGQNNDAGRKKLESLQEILKCILLNNYWITCLNIHISLTRIFWIQSKVQKITLCFIWNCVNWFETWIKYGSLQELFCGRIINRYRTLLWVQNPVQFTLIDWWGRCDNRIFPALYSGGVGSNFSSVATYPSYIGENINVVIPWSRVLLEKLIVAQLVKTSHAFYETRSSNSMFTGTLSFQVRGPVFYGGGLLAPRSAPMRDTTPCRLSATACSVCKNVNIPI
jgi:hypothetical protein